MAQEPNLTLDEISKVTFSPIGSEHDGISDVNFRTITFERKDGLQASIKMQGDIEALCRIEGL